MPDDLILSCLTVQQRCVLQIMAEAGLVGGSEEECAVYLITRGLDEMMRSGVLSLGSSDAPNTSRKDQSRG